MTEESLNRGIDLHDQIKTLKYILESMEIQTDLWIHFHKNLGEDMRIKDEGLVYRVLMLLKDRKVELEREFEKL